MQTRGRYQDRFEHAKSLPADDPRFRGGPAEPPQHAVGPVRRWDRAAPEYRVQLFGGLPQQDGVQNSAEVIAATGVLDPPEAPPHESSRLMPSRGRWEQDGEFPSERSPLTVIIVGRN